jgi:glutamine amidotransferase
MSPRVTIIDYGIGNLFSVCRAFEHCGAEVTVSGNPEQVASAERLVLPGVGAFADGMQGLVERRLDDVVRVYASSGRPLLGICLGMQMLATESYEFGRHRGLDIVPGKVLPVPETGIDGRTHKIPHIGWTSLTMPENITTWNDTIFSNVHEGDNVYLVHSFSLVPDDAKDMLADSDYDGRVICAAVRRRNVYGTQFHPEKSGAVGLRILQAFCDLPKAL